MIPIFDPLIASISWGPIDLFLSISSSMKVSIPLLLNSFRMWLRKDLRTSAPWKLGKTWCFQFGSREDRGEREKEDEAIIVWLRWKQYHTAFLESNCRKGWTGVFFLQLIGSWKCFNYWDNIGTFVESLYSGFTREVRRKICGQKSNKKNTIIPKQQKE